MKTTHSIATIGVVCLVALAGCDAGVEETTSTVRENAAQVGEAVDDATLTTKVKTALVAEEDVDAGAISVSSENGQVTLVGTVPPEQIARAEAVARSVDGVREVVNQLRTEGSAS